MSAVAGDLDFARAGILAQLTAVFFALRRHAGTRLMCALLTFLLSHDCPPVGLGSAVLEMF